MTGQLYAISLWQPWASLIFARSPDGNPIKVHETRHWAPAELGVIKRGQRLVIQAALTGRGYNEISDHLNHLCVLAWGRGYRSLLPRGAALGEATLADWYPAEPSAAFGADDLASGYWGAGRFAWRLEQPTLYELSRPMKGSQGFWRVDRT